MKKEADLCLKRVKQLDTLLQQQTEKENNIDNAGKNTNISLPSDPTPSSLSKSDQQEAEMREQILKCRVVPNPKYTWSDIKGLNLVKEIFQHVILIPLEDPEVLRKSTKFPRNILLFGPPGCGKTLLIQVLAAMVDIPLFSISASTLNSKWHGESQKMVRVLYETAWKFSPSIIFIDEFDGVFGTPKKGRYNIESPTSQVSIQIQKELQQFMDGMFTPSFNPTVTIVATNNPDQIQPAQLRRFDRVLYIAPPSEKTIIHLLTHYLRDIPHQMTPEDISFMARSLRFHTPDEVNNICASAYLRSLTTPSDAGSLPPPRKVTKYDFLNVKTDTPAILRFKDLDGVNLSKFRSFNNKFGNPQLNYSKHASELPRYSFEDKNPPWGRRSKNFT